ncbi:uncharacterized protein L201_000069 [Kwoniella dendrophila CBS 6074]|uniref:U3 small nucleolar RNA-associated protein 14 n=1 Tax=Kwoniella dendrophila CBS 6074 TaxID=1295534 RepID=A0AAX4JID9_9TREE
MARGSQPFSASTSSTAKKSKPSISSAKAKRRQDPSNAYTFLPSLPKRHRTSKAQLSISKDELESAGPSRRVQEDSDDEENEDMQTRIKRVAMMIADDENQGEIESDESDIDSDEAWNSDGSDEERWGDVFRELDKGKDKKGKSKAKEVVRKPAKPLTVNLDESEDDTSSKAKGKGKQITEEEFSSEDGEEDGEEDDDEEDNSDEDLEVDDDDQEEDEDDEDEEDEDSDMELPSDLSDDEEDPDNLDGLDAFVDSIASADKKRKAGAEDKVEEVAKKRRVLPVVSGPNLKENGELGLKSNQKLDLSSLISSHPSLAGASALLPSKSDQKSSTSILKQGLVSAPLPTVFQDRLDREAAYEKTREEGQKWAGVMKRVKEAEHLSFPLQPEQRGGVKTTNEILAGFKPSNQLESAVTALLNKANLTEDNMKKREDLALESQELTLEEIKEKRDALRYQRELMFRAEAKAKRVAKIKSKTFRKLARKRAAKENPEMTMDLEDLKRLDPEAAAEQIEKLERDRARERATLRHGAKSGRWARDVGGDGEELEDRRKAKEEMLEMKEKLQRKIMGKDEGSDSDSYDDNDDDDEDDEDEQGIKSKAFDQLAALNAQNSEPNGKAGKGLMQMAFMKKAQEREMQKVAETEAELRRDIEMFGQEGASDSEDDESDAEEVGKPSMMRVGGNEGRMVFSGNAGASSTQQVEIPEPAQVKRPSALSRPREPTPTSDEPLGNHNPWLTATSSAGPSRKRNAMIGSANAKAEDKVTRTLKKAVKGKEAELDDEKVEISLEAPESKSNGNKKSSKKGTIQGNGNGEEVDSDEESDEELMPISNKGIKAFKQRDLVAQAFAGDDVVEEFTREKEKQIELDAPKIEDTSLPGWGSWGGKGSKKNNKKPINPKFLIKTAGIEANQRKDFTRSNVIINEKKDKKASKHLLTDLPYPYTSKEQYERSFNNPVGSEWNSRSGFQKGTLPRIVKKPGAIIEPVRRMF